MSKKILKYTISLDFQEIYLPPFKDILVLGRKSSHGTSSILESINFLSPDNFELIELDDEFIEALLVNKKLLRRIPRESILELLRKSVFPYIDRGEMVRVDLNVKLSYEPFEMEVIKSENQ